MKRHDIDISFVRFLSVYLFRGLRAPNVPFLDSSANPWLDFLPAERAHTLARELNNDLEKYCSTSPEVQGFPGLKSIYGFGLLPLVHGISVPSVLDVIKQIDTLPHISGIIMGTRGVGSGLDDEILEPVWEALQETNLVVFIHPHYGVDSKSFGDKANGHVLPLALGFPFETTIVGCRHFIWKPPLRCITGDNSAYLGWRVGPLSKSSSSLGPFGWCPSSTVLSPCFVYRT